MSAGRRIDDKARGRNGQSALAASFAVILALGLASPLGACSKKQKAAAAADKPTPSGLPVPRYVSIRHTANARGGPGEDYKLLWTYSAKGLPLQVIAETPDWRKVCDPEGGVSWVHKRVLDSKRSVLRLSGGDLAMRKRPTEEAPLAATLVARSLADLDSCNEGWCKITAGGVSGWVRAGEVWGAAEGAQCGELRADDAPPGR